MTTGELHRLLATGGRFETLTFDCLVTTQTAVTGPEWVRRHREASKDRPAGSHAFFAVDDGADDDVLREPQHVWWRRPSCWREDLTIQGGSTVINVVCDTHSSQYVQMMRTLTIDKRRRRKSVDDHLVDMPLANPLSFASGWSLEVLGEGEHAGRAAEHVRATRLEPGTPRGGVIWTIDTFDLLVDRDRALILQAVGFIRGRQAIELSIGAVSFDEPIPDEIFAYEPPRGTTVIRD